MFAVLELPAKVTVEGTVATAVLLELRLMVSPLAGAVVDRVNVRLAVPPALTWSVPPGRLRVGVVTETD